jgi:cytohesin
MTLRYKRISEDVGKSMDRRNKGLRTPRICRFSVRSRAIAFVIAIAIFIFPSCGRNLDRPAAFDAAKNGDVASLKLMLQADPSLISAADDRGLTLLANAAASGQVEAVKFLLSDHADVEAKNIGLGTPLLLAAAGGHTEVARLLIDSHADVNAKDEYGNTSLHEMASQGIPVKVPTDLVELLLSHGANADARDEFGVTPLEDAVTGKHLDMIDSLLAHGSNVNAEDSLGQTALHSVARAGLPDMVDYLLAHGAELNAKDKSGRTPLDLAAIWAPGDGSDRWTTQGRKEVVTLLVKRGAASDIWVAVATGDLDGVKKFVEGNPAIVQSKDSYGKTPLHYAAALEQKDVAAFLVAHGAEVNARDNIGMAPLHSAARAGRMDTVELLLANKAEVDAKDSAAVTPLFEAAILGNNHADVVELLIAHGADPNAKDRVGHTPLMDAARDGDVARVLIAHGGHM